MNPYEILGLSSNASDAQIKHAYRRLVKEYHPDRNKNVDAHHRISQINQAYEILSDPLKRAHYDNPFTYYVTTIDPAPEDPVEAYKREFKRRRWEEEQAEKIKKENRKERTHVIMRFVAMPILVFASVLMIDRWLPCQSIEEVATEGFPKIQSSDGTVVRNSRSYMKTAHFTFPVDHDLHENYPYYAADKPLLKISYTPIFRVPRFASVTMDGKLSQFEIGGTIHTSHFFPWLLLVSSLFTVGYKKYTAVTYSLSFVPVYMLIQVLISMLG